MATSAVAARKVVFVDGARIPFAAASTKYNDKSNYDLARLAAKGIIDRTAIEPKEIDYVAWGNVIQDINTNNVAREVTLGAGLDPTTPSHTIGQACISSNQAICTGAEKILCNQADVVLAGGSETFSDVPIRFSKPLRQRMLGANKAMKKGPLGVLKLLKGLKLKDFAPEAPSIKNFSTGEVMGHSSDRLASRFGVSRLEQDEFALRSQLNAARYHAEGLYNSEIIPVDGSREENCIRSDVTIDSLSRLKPAFVKPHGTHTPGNSSPLTDGAAGCLIMSDSKAKELDFTPRAHIKSWNFVAVDPFESMLLGPAFAIAKLFKDNGVTLHDIGVFEIHEAFAGQVLANLAALDSESFCKETLGLDKKIGRIPVDKINLGGGSLSIGHPFGATGSRLVTTAVNHLHSQDSQLALVAACADGGVGHAALIERM
eukprot:CAMPEP_0203749514 /NCGR_PEP_ID=MMETSP0098-20131031/4054_1 /ASSEMBLY_ACC=CAM_ASM_000208 /TAXON_ID=96639 /ORGANISM=" , Strain NY0313808BC1" /LENGTH=428 /DNA_ID=CAMNT_0050638587 /DNA_START=128 /DNA_END=1414 /DNA_ORIENTATION=+